LGRVAGDGLDILTLLAAAARPGNRKRGNVGFALAMVLAVTMLDLMTAQAVAERHGRRLEGARRYADRSGFTKGLENARGAARDFKPKYVRASPPLASEPARLSELRGTS
jgi:hypothetical protein